MIFAAKKFLPHNEWLAKGHMTSAWRLYYIKTTPFLRALHVPGVLADLETAWWVVTNYLCHLHPWASCLFLLVQSEANDAFLIDLLWENKWANAWKVVSLCWSHRKYSFNVSWDDDSSSDRSGPRLNSFQSSSLQCCLCIQDRSSAKE
jgi:hypothetical protein